MLHFLSANLGTITVSILLLAIVGLVIRSLIVNKRKGRSACGCGCGCGNCPSAGICHGGKNQAGDWKA